jgi:ribonuclease BN (tRNA processing enzyme)
MRRLTFLGTGDPLNGERAQTSLALTLADDEILLLDTGSGSNLLRQLTGAGLPLAAIRHVAVSHAHFDHAGGLAPLLVALAALPEARVTVHASAPVSRALHDTLALVIPGVEAWLGPRLDWHILPLGVPVAVADLTLTAFPVEHGIPTAGFRLVQEGHTLTFSADTVPCTALDAAARGADLLIHEAYGLDVAAEVAHRFGHATAADAGRAARSGGVGRLILTHLRSTAHADPAALVAEAAAHYPGPLSAACDFDVVEW